jgi:sulfur carrier protein
VFESSLTPDPSPSPEGEGSQLSMISITLNGRSRSLDSAVTVPLLLEQLDIDPRRIAVAINDEVIPKNQYQNTTMRDGDVVEIVRMVGGG